MRLLFALFITIFACPACSESGPSHFQGGNPENEVEKSVMMAPPAALEPSMDNIMDTEGKESLYRVMPVKNMVLDEAQKIPAQIIKNADIRFQVEDLEKSIQAVQKAVSQFGGYVASSSESRGGELSVNFSLRVPAAQFEKVLDELLKQSSFLVTKNITSEDVTEQFVDIQARLKTKKEAEKRYVEILRLARTVKDVLTVEEQLRMVREEIEAQEGRLKFLRDQVRYSSIALVMYKPVPYQAQPEIGFFSKLLEGIQQGWNGLLSVIVVLASFWPLWLVLAAGLVIVRKWRSRQPVA
jgi:hypothetical protein